MAVDNGDTHPRPLAWWRRWFAESVANAGLLALLLLIWEAVRGRPFLSDVGSGGQLAVVCAWGVLSAGITQWMQHAEAARHTTKSGPPAI